MAKHGLSLIDIQKAFGTETQCLDYLEAARWPEGVTCLKCGSDKVNRFTTNETTRERKNRKGEIKEVRVPSRHLYQCNNEGCRHQFSATAGTIFDKSHLSLCQWFMAIGIMVNAKKSVSAKQMERDLGVNYRTAWHLCHRIREAMQSDEGLFGGTVEVDATFVGGKYDPRRKRGPYEKQAVAGVIQRRTDDKPSQVRAFPVEREIAQVMTKVVRDNVVSGAEIMTDEHVSDRMSRERLPPINCCITAAFSPVKSARSGGGARTSDLPMSRSSATFASTMTGPRASSRSNALAVASARRSSYSRRVVPCSGNSGQELSAEPGCQVLAAERPAASRDQSQRRKRDAQRPLAGSRARQRPTAHAEECLGRNARSPTGMRFASAKRHLADLRTRSGLTTQALSAQMP